MLDSLEFHWTLPHQRRKGQILLPPGPRPVDPVAAPGNTGSQEDPDAFIEADLDFHLALAEAAANPIILSLIDSIVGLLREQRMRIFHVEGGPERGQYHHKRIMEALEKGDPLGAREAMKAHLRQVREDSSHAASAQD